METKHRVRAGRQLCLEARQRIDVAGQLDIVRLGVAAGEFEVQAAVADLGGV